MRLVLMQLMPCLVLIGLCAAASAQQASITVHPEQVIVKQLSRYMTGACLEDVNHEVYGGIYSQMIFGESFQEPPLTRLAGFKGYGGSWGVKDGVLTASGDQGPKLVSDRPEFGDGEIAVSVLTQSKSGNAGIVVKLRNPGNGADSFEGYEIALDSARQMLVLGRHRMNWEPISETPCKITPGQWMRLAAKMSGDQLEVLVDGKSIVTYREDGLKTAGTFGLRVWQQEASYKDLQVTTDGKAADVAFQAAGDVSGSVSGMWEVSRTGTAKGKADVDTTEAWVGRQSQRIEFTDGQGQIGISNMGLNRWGMSYVKGKPYEGVLRVRVSKPTTFFVAMESAEGSKLYAEKSLVANPSGWQKISFSLTPNATDPKARFSINLKEPGAMSVGYCFLQPGTWGRYKGLPVRKDVVDGLVEQGVTVLRYGGSMVNTDEYRWKKMIGPRDARPPYAGFWHPDTTNGWGIIDFIATCDAAGFLGIPAINMGESPQDMADFIEYVNGPATSTWGKKRAEDGHPKPFGLKYLEMGNEERVNEEYWQKFKPLAEAIWAKDPDIILVVGDFIYRWPIVDPYKTDSNPNVNSLDAHKKILDLATQNKREVWFDIHVSTDDPRHLGDYIGPRTLTESLRKIAPDAKFKVVVFELNAGNHGVKRMLASAKVVGEFMKESDDLPIVTSANCLQPDGQNDNGWNQGLLFLNPAKVWAQPPYYLTQLMSRNYLPQVVASDTQSTNDALSATATKSKDGKILQVQVVNVSDQIVPTRLDLNGFTPSARVASVAEVSGGFEDANTAENPDRVVPKNVKWQHELSGGRTTYTFPAHSFTILRFE